MTCVMYQMDRTGECEFCRMKHQMRTHELFPRQNFESRGDSRYAPMLEPYSDERGYSASSGKLEYSLNLGKGYGDEAREYVLGENGGYDLNSEYSGVGEYSDN